MTDSAILTFTGRIVSEPKNTEKGSVMLQTVANLWQRPTDDNKNEHPMFVTCILSGPKAKFVTAASERGPLTGCEVTISGEFNFNKFTRKDKTQDVGFTVFPNLVKLGNRKQSESRDVEGSQSSDNSKKEDDLPF